MNLSPTEIYKDRRIFLIGSTGFLGKVTLSMLLHRFPNIGKVYVTVRARSQEESETRFWNSIITAPPFDPLRERYGNALDGFIEDKVVIKGGDIAETNFGYTEEEAQAIADDIDIIINSAGNVTFNPTLESGLRTNVVGTQNVIAFARRMKRPALVQCRPALKPNHLAPFGKQTKCLLLRANEMPVSSSLLTGDCRLQNSPIASERKLAMQ